MIGLIHCSENKSPSRTLKGIKGVAAFLFFIFLVIRISQFELGYFLITKTYLDVILTPLNPTFI